MTTSWHSDDSPEQDPTHPIAVVSFVAERYIWTRPIGAKGVIPVNNRYLLKDGSLFMMPAGFQEAYQHRIPKHDRPCGGRISMTFRKFKPNLLFPRYEIGPGIGNINGLDRIDFS